MPKLGALLEVWERGKPPQLVQVSVAVSELAWSLSSAPFVYQNLFLKCGPHHFYYLVKQT